MMMSQPLGVSAPRDSDADLVTDWKRPTRSLPKQLGDEDGSKRPYARKRKVISSQGKGGRKRKREVKLDLTEAPFPDTDHEDNHHHDEDFVAEAEEASRRMYGPAVKPERKAKLSEVFKMSERRPERLDRVMDIITTVYLECVGDDNNASCKALQGLNLDSRASKLDHNECQTLADVLMSETCRAMEKAGFKGLNQALVEEELLHMKLHMQYEEWYPMLEGKRKPTAGNLKDWLYDLLVRRNYAIAERESRLVVWTFARAYGLKDIQQRQPDVSYMEKAAELRGRVCGGVLVLRPEELDELAEDKHLVAQIVTAIATEDVSDLTMCDAVPWLRSYAAVQLLASKVMGKTQWNQMVPVAIETLTHYGDLLLRSLERGETPDPYFETLRAPIKRALREHRSSMHVFLRVTSEVMGVDSGFVNFIDCESVDEDSATSYANGTEMPMTIICLRNAKEKRHTGYSVRIQGKRMFSSDSLKKTYAVFFLLSNLLFIDSAPGSRSTREIVAVVNQLVYDIRYEKDPLGKKYQKLMAELSRRERQEKARKQLQ